jgi:hypothetical protein
LQRRTNLDEGLTGDPRQAPRGDAATVGADVRHRLDRDPLTRATAERLDRRGRRASSALDLAMSTVRQEGRLLMRGRSKLLLPALVLAMTVGAALALTRVIDTAFWQPMPFPSGDRLIALTPYQLASGQRFGRVPMELLEATHADELLEAVASVSSRKVVWLSDSGSESLEVALLSRQAPTLFGLRPLAGRLLGHADFTNRAGDEHAPIP